MNKKLFSLIIIAVLGCYACKPETKKTSESWDEGQVNIVADSNLKVVLEPLVTIYEHYFPKAKIDFQYASEDKVIQDFKQNNNNVIATNRLLDENELHNAAIAQGVTIGEYTFAYDAVAVIANKDFKDSVFKIENISSILQNKNIQLVFDNPKSGIARLLMQLSQTPATDFKNALALQSSTDLLNYIAAHQNAIGFIPFHLLSNNYENETQYILNHFKVLNVSYKEVTTAISQQSIADAKYPLIRPITIYIGRCSEQVIKGFTGFLLKRQISKAILLSGLVPKNMPIRDVVVTDKFNPNGNK